MSTNASDAPGNKQGTARSARPAAAAPRSTGDRIQDLIIALGDANHPLHASAISDLVALGQPSVGPLSAALARDRPWLTAYRAAEALAKIGDGGANGALLTALRHPNSNVRWSAIRALAEVGDSRALWALRRVVHEDRGKTSWGEVVADTAQAALDRLQSRSVLLRFREPATVALLLVLALGTVLLATTRLQTVLPGDVPVPVIVTGPAATTTRGGPDETAMSLATIAAITTTTTVTPMPELIGTVTRGGRIRSGPGVNYLQIGSVSVGDQLVFLSSDPAGTWYRVTLAPHHASNSRISGSGAGWVSALLIGTGKPAAPVPIEQSIR